MGAASGSRPCRHHRRTRELARPRPAEIIRTQADASVNAVFVAVADRCGAERGTDWVGGSVIIGPDGYPLAGPADPGKPAVLTAACELPRARDKSTSPRNDVLTDRRPVLYASLNTGR